MSFKEVLLQIKNERMESNMEKRKEEAAINSLNNGGGIQEESIELRQQDNVVPSLEICPPQIFSRHIPEIEESDVDVDGDAQEVRQTRVIELPVSIPKPDLAFCSGYLVIEGLGRIELQVDGNSSSVIINDQELGRTEYQSFNNPQIQSGSNSNSFVFTQPGNNSFSIRLTIENHAKMMKLAA